MNTAIEYVETTPVLVVSGRLDATSAPAFDAEMASVLATPRKHILLDMSGVSYVSSAGLRSVLLLIKHTAANGGRLGVFGAPPAVMEVIEISGFPSLLDLYADRDTALAGTR
jgi:anti-anti-sigma factor